MAKVILPRSLGKYTRGELQLIFSCHDLEDVADYFEANHKELFDVLYHEDKTLKRFVCLYLNAQLIRDAAGVKLTDHDTLELMLALSGG